MKINILSTGSKGNCAILDNGKSKIMIDCGLKFEDITTHKAFGKFADYEQIRNKRNGLNCLMTNTETIRVCMRGNVMAIIRQQELFWLRKFKSHNIGQGLLPCP